MIVVIVVIAVATSGGSGSSNDNASPTTVTSAPGNSGAAQPAEQEPANNSAVKITAKKAAFTPTILYQDGSYTSVKVTVVNNSTKSVDINPLFFSITDTTGSKHTAELAMDKEQIDTVKLAPGENVTGVITGKGKFSPKYVTFTADFFGKSVRGDVS